MQWSHSRVELFEKCKFKYKMRYLDGIKTIAPTEADNALILGTALHTGIEKDVETAIREYCFSYPIITDEHINEIIKLETVIPLARAALPGGGAFEVPIMTPDFTGFIDYLVPCGKGLKLDGLITGEDLEEFDGYDLYDFKYTNNSRNYRDSPQLHLYKYFWEKANPGKKIRRLYFLFVPKVNIKQKKNEDLAAFRARIRQELERVAVRVQQVNYNPEKVIEWSFGVKAALEAKDFPPERSFLCRYCEYQEFCEKGWDYFMKLPENKRRNIETVKKRVIWIYGAPFCGKTTFANGFPDPLMLNTDGNFRFVDAPVISIKDNVTVEGRITRRKMAWEVFKEVIDELEKKDNTFKTIIVDLLEDTYEHCRRYMYHETGITHESDDPFRAWDKVRGEFLNTLKRLMNLDYENIILISHEDTSRDLTRKTGDKISAIKPNLPDKVANKVAGMVDVVARIVADGDTRTFNFKADEVVFGGGRLRVDGRSIPLSVEALFGVYDAANANRGNYTPATETASTGRKRGGSKGDKAKDKPTTQETAPDNADAATETPATGADTPPDGPADEGAGKDTPETETPAEGAETATEEAPRRKRRNRDAADVNPTDTDGATAPSRGASGATEAGASPTDDPVLPHCPDGERIFRQHRESNSEIPLCPNIDAGFHCHKYGDPSVCPLLGDPDAAPATGDAATTNDEPPRRKRRARN